MKLGHIILEPVYKRFRQYQTVLEKVSAAWTPQLSLQGRIHGVFRKRYLIRASFLNTNAGYFVNNLLGRQSLTDVNLKEISGGFGLYRLTS